jgi:transposase
MLATNLNESEIHRVNYERFHYPCPLVQKRIHAVYLKKAFGFSNEMIGQMMDLSRNTVGQYVRAYDQNGLEALCQFRFGTNRSELENHSIGILESFSERPPMNSREAQARILEMTGISRSQTQIREFMKRHGLKYVKTGHIPAKVDEQRQAEWLEETLMPAIEQAQSGECVLLFMDAAHFILQPFICAMWCLTRLFIRASSGRNRINVLGALNAVTKEVISFSNTTFINAEVIVDFLHQLREHYPGPPLKIVLDNARYQHCNLVKSVAESLKIELLFLPPYSPNLNIIERLWRFTKKTLLYGTYYDTPAKFHQAINGFFSTINSEHQESLEKLLTLKFQSFKNENARF